MTAVLREFLDADAAFKATGPVDDRAGLLAVVCAHSTAASKIAPALRALLDEVEGLRVEVRALRYQLAVYTTDNLDLQGIASRKPG